MSAKPPRDETSIKLRCDTSVKEAIVGKAASAHLTVTDYMIRAALNRRINNSFPVELVTELHRLSMQQKSCHATDRRNERTYRAILDSIVSILGEIQQQVYKSKAETADRASPWAHDDGGT